MKKAGFLFTVFVVLALTGCGALKEQNSSENGTENSTENSTENTTGMSIESTGENTPDVVSGSVFTGEENRESEEGGENQKDNVVQNTEEKRTYRDEKMILSGENWIYSDKEFGFNLKLPKKYWSDPRLLIKENEKDIKITIFIPGFDESYINEEIPETSSIPRRYEGGTNYFISSAEEYRREMQDEDNGRGLYDTSGIEMLKNITIGHNNKYYFLELQFYQRGHEHWKDIVPALECGENENGLFSCSGAFDDMFPEGMITFFDV